jgi:hypothetical protein
MYVRRAIASLIAFSCFLFLAGCGSSSPKVVAPPSGGFSASSLNGTYVFSSSGVDVNGGYLTIVGDFTANGSGTISGGALDIAGSNAGVASNQPIASGGSSYSVTSDGRGQVKLNGGSALGLLVFDFVLTSTTHGLITEYDGNGSGSGTMDLQTTISQSQLAGSYTFGVAGTGTSASFATIGAVTLDASGNVTTGLEDINNGGGASTAVPITTSSNILLGTGTAPGTAVISTSSSAYSFDVYPIDSTHLKLIETDGLIFTSGDVFTQGTSIPAGTLVYTFAGFDVNGYPVSGGGFLPTDSSGNVTAGLEDFNDNGSVNSSSSVSGAFSALTGGRSQVTLANLENGATNNVLGTYTFAAYPFAFSGGSGIELLEIDNAGITSGTAYLQSGTAFAASQGYGLNLSAINTSNVASGGSLFEEDDIAEFTSTSGGFSGIVDINDEGTTTFDKALSGNYAAAGTGEYSVTSNYFGFNLYVVNGSTALVLETDSNQVGTGIVGLQTAPAVPGAIAGPAIPPMLRPAAAHSLKARRK